MPDQHGLLLVVDMQNDFISGALGTREARAILPAVARKIKDHQGPVLFTRDTHQENYLDTQEGQKLPLPHCIKATPGWEIHEDLTGLVPMQVVDKPPLAPWNWRKRCRECTNSSRCPLSPL